MKTANMEFRVGLFVAAAAVLLSYMVIRAGDLYLRPGYTVRLVFDTVSGIDKGSPIRLAGVPVGEVKGFRALKNEDGKKHVEITAFIEDGVHLEEDSQMYVAAMGFLGEKYIEIHPGTPGSNTLEPGGTLVGRELTGMDDLFGSGQELIQKMEYMVEDIRGLVGDQEFKTSVKGTFTNGEQAMKNLNEATANLKDASASAKVVLGRLERGEGTVGRLLKEDKMARDMEAFASDIKAHPWKLLKRN